MSIEKNLVLEAKIDINSEEILIVDPAYLADFDRGEND